MSEQAEEGEDDLVWLEIGRTENSAAFFCRMFPKRWDYTLEENEKTNFQGSKVTGCKFYVPMCLILRHS